MRMRRSSAGTRAQQSRTPRARTISTRSRSTPCWRGGRPNRRGGTPPRPAVSTRRRSRSSRTTGGPGTTGRGCSRTSPGRRRRSSTRSRRPRATRADSPERTPPRWLRRGSSQPDLRPEHRQQPIDEGLGEVGSDLARPVREEALAVVVEAGDLGEAGLAEQPLQLAWRVAHLGDAVLVARLAALEPVLPVRLHEQEPAPWPERPPGRAQDEVGVAAVVEGVVEKCRIEAPAEVEGLHVGDLERRVGTFLLGELAGDRDHLRGDVVAVCLEAVAGREAGHPAAPASSVRATVPPARSTVARTSGSGSASIRTGWRRAAWRRSGPTLRLRSTA